MFSAHVRRLGLALLLGMALTALGLGGIMMPPAAQASSDDLWYVTSWGGPGLGEGQLSSPRGVAVAPNGTVYVADTLNNRIQLFAADGQPLGMWGKNGGDGSWGVGEGEFREPWGVAVSYDGEVYVADTLNNRIQWLAADGKTLGMWGAGGGGGAGGGENGEFVWPRGVAVNRVVQGSDVYVADSGNNRVQRFTAAGSYLSKWGAPGTGDGQFNTPIGICADAQGSWVHVADVYNKPHPALLCGWYLRLSVGRVGHAARAVRPSQRRGDLDRP
jgi:DNA-binding beta-propeller fold protein YncE